MRFFALCLIFICASCKTDLKEYYGRHGTFTPAPMYFEGMPEGDDEYSQGFRDGCNTAFRTVGTGLLSVMYDDTYYDFDKILDSDDYYKGMSLGMSYCTNHLDTDPF